MMQPTTLEKFLIEEKIKFLDNGILINIQPSWIVKGEDHISYTTVMKLVECCREYHWEKDIKPLLDFEQFDSITKSISAEFKRPIVVDSEIIVEYKIIRISSKGYEICFEFKNYLQNISFALINVVIIFYDMANNMVHVPPKRIHDRLMSLMRKL